MARAATHETERAIQELLGIERSTLAPVRPEDEPDALLVPQSEDVPGPYSGPYEAGGVWAVFDGHGVAAVNGTEVAIPYAGAYELIVHEHHTEACSNWKSATSCACSPCASRPGLLSRTCPRASSCDAGPGAGKAIRIVSPPPARGCASISAWCASRDRADDRESESVLAESVPGAGRPQPPKRLEHRLDLLGGDHLTAVLDDEQRAVALLACG